MTKTFFITYNIILSLVDVSYAQASNNFFQSLRKSKKELLSHLESCTFRLVYMENSIPATDDTLLFLEYYNNHGIFILESIPASHEDYMVNQTYLTRSQDKKFMSCYSIFYFQDQLFQAIANIEKTSPAEIIRSYFQQYPVLIRNENPPIVVFITFSKKISASNYRFVHKIDTTSSFFVLSAVHVKLICAKCGKKIFHEPESIVSDSTWRKMYIRHGKIAVSDRFSEEWDTNIVNSFYTCAVSPDPITSWEYPGAQKCLLRVLKQKLNTTDSRDIYAAYGLATYLVMLSINVEELLDREFRDGFYNRRYEPVSYGMSLTRYRFGTLTNNLHGQDISSLTRPFDVLIWIFLILSTFCVTLSFRAFFGDSQTWSTIGIFVISILLEQSPNIVNNVRYLRKQVYFLFVLWLLLSLLVSNAYKGVLFSFLATPTVPRVPETLSEVVNSNMLIATSSEFEEIIDDKRVRKAKLQKWIESYLEKLRAGTTSVNQDEDTYIKLKESMLCVRNNRLTNMFIAMESGTEIDSVIRGKSINCTIPRKLIFIDEELFVDLFGELNSLFTNNVFIQGRSLDLFTETEQWVVQRNAFLRLLRPILSALEEAGLYTRWEYFENILSVNKILKSTRKTVLNALKESKSLFSAKDNVLAYLLFKPYTAISVTEPVPISLKFFKVFALLFAYCLAICGVAFFFEIIIYVGLKQVFFTCRNRIIGVWFHRKFGFPLSYTP